MKSHNPKNTAPQPGKYRGALQEGHVQMDLFDERNLLEIASPMYPGERLVACRNPSLAQLRAKKRRTVGRHGRQVTSHPGWGGSGSAQRGRGHQGNCTRKCRKPLPTSAESRLQTSSYAIGL
jgi:hypothetical protein